MLVSVVIPVYRAEDYVGKAVESALGQPETGEVLLIEDNSPDGSLEICRGMAKRHEKVRLLRHPSGENRGAGASRNLGILNATCEVVAFLDADDYYVDRRFSEAAALLAADPEVDGVYEAVGTHFENPRARENWLSSGREELTTMNAKVPPRELFLRLLEGGGGWLHLDGLTVRRSVFQRSGLFFEHLRLHQDSAMFYQMAAFCRLVPGRLSEPVAMRRVHDHNRISGADVLTRVLYWKTLFDWALERKLERQTLQILFYKYIYSCFAQLKLQFISGNAASILRWLLPDLFNHPSLFIPAVWHYSQNRRITVRTVYDI